MNEPNRYRALLETILSGIAYSPVKITETEIGVNVLRFDVACDGSDAGLIYGKDGRNIKAISELFKAAAYRDRRQIDICVHPRNERRFNGARNKPKPWNEQAALQLTEDIIKMMQEEVSHISFGRKNNGSLAITILPEPSLANCQKLDLILHAWGKTHGKNLGIAPKG